MAVNLARSSIAGNVLKYAQMKKPSRKPKGKNIEVALELLQLSLVLKASVKKAAGKK